MMKTPYVRKVRPMKQAVVILLCFLLLTGCSREPEPMYEADDILGIWYAVEYEESVEFLADGTVEDTYNGKVSRGFWTLDSEAGLLWINFGDDVFSIQISDQSGNLTLIDNNGTLVREADRDAAREAYRESRHTN